jgi:hypothetical protein
MRLQSASRNPCLVFTATPLLNAHISSGLKRARPVAMSASRSSTNNTSSCALKSGSAFMTCFAKAVLPAPTNGADSAFTITRSFGYEKNAWSRRAPNSPNVKSPSDARSVATLIPPSRTWLTLRVRDSTKVTVSGKRLSPAPGPNW